MKNTLKIGTFMYIIRSKKEKKKEKEKKHNPTKKVFNT